MTDAIDHFTQNPPLDYGSPGEIGEGLNTTLEAILHELQQPSVRPKAQIVLNVAGAAAASDGFNTHVRYYIEKIIFVNGVATNINFFVGSSKILQNLAPGTALVYECAIIIDSGVDISFATINNAAMFAGTVATSIILLGEIIN